MVRATSINNLHALLKWNKFLRGVEMKTIVVLFMLAFVVFACKQKEEPKLQEQWPGRAVQATPGNTEARGVIPAGKYINEKNANDYLEFKADGTFLLQERRHDQASRVSGKYEIKGTQITLTIGLGQSVRGKLEGKTFVDDGGNRWTKR
jgi:hypothetical protein